MNYSADPAAAGGPPAVTEGTPDGPIALALDSTAARENPHQPAR
jgi:hypothetical protein